MISRPRLSAATCWIILAIAGLSQIPAAATGAGNGAEPTTRPGAIAIARTDPQSRRAHDQLVQRAKAGGIDLYFEGDSITRRWAASEPQYADLLANWNRNFGGWKAADFGWGGDTVQNILWRLQNGELDQVNPKVIVLMAGTNNVGVSTSPAADPAVVQEVLDGTAEILDSMHQKAPNATIILMGITPRKDDPRHPAMSATIERINAGLARFNGEKIRFLNINDKLTDPGGKLLEGMTRDGLHLSARGYQIWADALKPLLTEALGPPPARNPGGA